MEVSRKELWFAGCNAYIAVSARSYGIDREEYPMMGLYAISNASATIESPICVPAFLSSVSATVATILPVLYHTATYVQHLASGDALRNSCI